MDLQSRFFRLIIQNTHPGLSVEFWIHPVILWSIVSISCLVYLVWNLLGGK